MLTRDKSGHAAVGSSLVLGDGRIAGSPQVDGSRHVAIRYDRQKSGRIPGNGPISLQ